MGESEEVEFEDPVASLREKFSIFDRPKEWIVNCPKCGASWALRKSPNVSVGSLLYLFNHAASHQVRP